MLRIRSGEIHLSMPVFVSASTWWRHATTALSLITSKPTTVSPVNGTWPSGETVNRLSNPVNNCSLQSAPRASELTATLRSATKTKILYDFSLMLHWSNTLDQSLLGGLKVFCVVC